MGTKPKQITDHDCEKIIHDCLWEYSMSNEELLQLAQNGTDQEKFFLFCKILENSQDVLKSLNIFSVDDQKKMLHSYTPPKFKHHFLKKRHSVIKFLLTGEEIDIPELRWNT